jgi:hypothetical protein
MVIEFRNKLAACSTQQVSAVTEKLVLVSGKYQDLPVLLVPIHNSTAREIVG